MNSYILKKIQRNVYWEKKIKSYYLLFLYLIFICGDSAISQEILSETVLVDAFEKGRSLVIADILSKEVREDGMCNVKIKVVKPVIPGDLTEDDCEGILDLLYIAEV